MIEWHVEALALNLEHKVNNPKSRIKLFDGQFFDFLIVFYWNCRIKENEFSQDLNHLFLSLVETEQTILGWVFTFVEAVKVEATTAYLSNLFGEFINQFRALVIVFLLPIRGQPEFPLGGLKVIT